MKRKGLITSVLRYPGGKSRAIWKIVPLIPSNIKEFREPMVGGGSVSLAMKQLYPHIRVWINDVNYDLICFWKTLRDHPDELVSELKRIKRCCKNGRELYNRLKKQSGGSEFERAVRFFVLNRISFSGLVGSGGYSEHSFRKKFTLSHIERLRRASVVVQDFEITHGGYEPLLFREGEGVFVFLDPPYYSTAKSRLYGKNGSIHLEFDHEKFADDVRRCTHPWLITYDDCSDVRRLFHFGSVCTWELQYSMGNRKGTTKKGKELFITTHEIPCPSSPRMVSGAYYQVCTCTDKRGRGPKGANAIPRGV